MILADLAAGTHTSGSGNLAYDELARLSEYVAGMAAGG